MEIFKLVGNIMVDSSDAEKSISKTGDKADGLASKLGNGIKTAAKWGAGLVAAATAVGTAIVATAKDTASSLDTIDKASIRMGVTAEEYQELAHAAGLCGVEMSTLETAAKTLQSSGSELSLEEAIAEVQAIGDESERTAKAVELFGSRAAYSMSPLLDAGTESMEEMVDEAHELGLVMSNDVVKDGAAMNDMFTKIEESFSTVKTALASELMPYVMEILEWIIEEIPAIKETISNVLDAILPIVQPILEGLMSFIKGIFDLINGDTDGFIEGIKGMFSGLAEGMLQLGKDIFESLFEGFKAIWEKISGWVTEKVEWIKSKFKGAKDEAGSTTSSGESHAGGLPYVPYDNYSANLHRGEMVLTAAEAQAWRNGSSGGNVVNIYPQSLSEAQIDYLYSRMNSRMGVMA